MSQLPDEFRGPWFSTRQAQAYIPCASLRAVYAWCNRHGIIRRSNGSIAKADIDRVLNPRNRKRRQMAPASLANLRKRAGGMP